MKRIFRNTLLIFTIAQFLFGSGCKKEEIPTATLTTTAITSITQTSATSGGNITADGGSTVTVRGVCWSTGTTPTIADSKTANGAGAGAFTSSITGLTAGTTYYVRAYATNASGTGYGMAMSFITQPATIPVLTTANVTTITQNIATSGGTISSDGTASITARGVCWSTSTNPTVANSITTDGTGTGAYTSLITGLAANTTYYVRAYATNSAGTAYGTQLSFKTLAEPPIITTSTITGITPTFAVSGGNITSNGGATVTARGVCWSTSANPTIANSKTTDGAGTGAFTSSITGLAANTTYYVRAYATNSSGTGYGSAISFTTQNYGTVTDIEGNVYKTVTIGSHVWMAENLKTTKYNDGTAIPNITDRTAWAALTTGAYSDYSNTPANSTTYGRLYNWYAVDNNAATKVASNGGKNVCPTSWHVPTDTEWTTLTTYLGGESVAGGKLKETGTTHWLTPNIGATNETGFTALPGGNRLSNGSFYFVGNYGGWWSSTEFFTANAWYRYMYYNNTNVFRYDNDKRYGLSVRCVRDF